MSRVGVASTIGLCFGTGADGALADGPLGEDLLLSLAPAHLPPAFETIGELLIGHLADATGIDIINLRISATWGPGGHLPDPSSPPRP